MSFLSRTSKTWLANSRSHWPPSISQTCSFACPQAASRHSGDDIPLTNAGSDARLRLVDQSVVDGVSIALAPDLLAWDFFLGLSLLSAAIVFKGDRFQTNIRYNSAVQDVISNCAGSHGNLPTVQDCKPGFRRNLH